MHKIKFFRLCSKAIFSIFSLLLLVNASLAQNITGQVIDDTDLPLIGATVVIQGTTIGTSTDNDGKFSLLSKKDDVLVINYLGYKTKEIINTGETNLIIRLETDASTLDELVIIGYGTQKKSHLTGAISKVENKALDQISVARVDDALIGQVSGVNIQASSAEAGGAPTIRIRGVGSVSGEAGPAVVVDGLVVDSDFLGNLNMNDIASFEVLKDAASAAIYGSEGSNGVIIITTKNGAKGKTKFSYETYVGFKSAHESEGYKKSVAEWADFERAQNGELTERTLYMQQLVDDTGIDRDWQEVFFDGGLINSHSFSARGGGDKTNFSTSFRYLHDEGVVITDDYKLYSVNLKMNTKITDKLKFGISATPSYSKRRALPTSVHNPIRQSPWLPIYHTQETIDKYTNTTDPDGEYYNPDLKPGDYFLENHLIELDLNGDGSDTRPRTSGDMNPYAQYVEREHFEFKTNLLGSAFLQYDIIDGLTAKTAIGTTIEQRKRTRWNGTKHHAQASRASYELQNRFRTRVIWDNTLNYSKDVGNHEYTVLIGSTAQRRQSENSAIEGSGYENDLIKNLSAATLFSEISEINVEQNKIGLFARVNYAFANKYLVNASIRRDGSSVFGDDNKWGNFPAISFGWNAHNENFLNKNNFLSRLKLRVSYGLTGNENIRTGDDLINAYPNLAFLDNTNAVTSNAITNGVSPLNIANTTLQWEASKEFNPGIDFGFLSNRIMGSIDYYVRTSDQLLLNNPVSYITGFDAGLVNLGKVANSGFEFEIRTRNVVQGPLKWSTTVIASTNKNELLDFADSNGQLTEDGFGRNSEWINLVGNPISSFYGYVVDEAATEAFTTANDADGNPYWDTPFFPINSVSEDAVVKDLNGDGLISEEDKAILGNPYPDLIWSLTNEFEFRNFDFSFMVQGSQGAQVKNIGDQYFGTHWQGGTENPSAAVDAGLVPHASFLQARVLTNDVVQSAGYFSLRNVNLGYSLSNDRLTKLGFSNLRLYVTGQNLLYNTSDSYNGFNPEYIDTNNSPTAYGSQRAGTPLFRTFSIGANVNF